MEDYLLADELPEDEMDMALEKDDIGESDEESDDLSETDEHDETASISTAATIKVPRLPTGVVNKKSELRIKLVPKDQRMCSDYINQQELTAVIAMRAEQISKSGVSFVETDSIDPIVRAKLEIVNKRCPMVIRRKVDISGIYEDWDVNELNISYNIL